MIISPTHGFVFICMPKCASTSTEAILKPYADIMTGDSPGYKHMTYRKYKKFLEPLVCSKLKNAAEPPEVLSLFREPVDWLYSWYRYRQRDALQSGPGRLKSTNDMSFEEFAQQYVSEHPSFPARVGRQVNMLKGKNGKIGNITLFRYENYDAFLDYMSVKVGKKLKARVLNKSPSGARGTPPDLPFLREYLREEYEVYNSIST